MPNKKIVNILDLYETVNKNVIYSTDLEDNKIIYEDFFEVNLNISNYDNKSLYEVTTKINDEIVMETKNINKDTNLKIKLADEGKKKVNIIIYRDGEEKGSLEKTIYYIKPYKSQFLEEQGNKGIKLIYDKKISASDWDKSIDLLKTLGTGYIRTATKLSLASNKSDNYDYSYIGRLIEKTENTKIKIASAISDIGNFGGEDKIINTDEELEDVLNVVEYVIKQYKDIDNLEIFNEPNYMFPRYSTEEEIKYYAEIVKRISEIAKSIKPNIKVISGSVACIEKDSEGKVPYKTFWNKITKYGAYKYSNAYSYHPYEFYKSNTPNIEYSRLLTDSKNEFNNYGGFLKNYITEYGISNYTENNFTEDEQAIRLIQQTTINDKFGVDFSLIYVFRNPGNNSSNAEHNFGLVNSDYTPKLSYYALKNYYENTNGSEYIGTINLKEGLEVHVYDKDGKPRIIAWSNNSENNITLAYKDFKAKDLYGKEIGADQNGNITITTSPVYLNDISSDYFYGAISNTATKKYQEFREKFSNELSKIPELSNKIEQEKSYMLSIKEKPITEETSIKAMKDHYELGNLLIQKYKEGKLHIEYAKLSSMLDMLDDIGDSYEDLVTVTSKTVDQKELDQTSKNIQETEELINDNKDLEIIYPSKILDFSKEYSEKANYINDLEEENDIKAGLIISKNLHARLLENWAKEFAQIYIDDYIANNPVEIKYSETEITNKNIVATIQTNAEIQITNNNGNKEHTFEENGTFTYEYTIKGQAFTKTAEVKNIDKDNPEITGVENGKIYKPEIEINVIDENLSEVKIILNEEEIEYKPNMKLEEEGFYTITAKDKAGNKTSINVGIFSEHKEYQIKEETIQNIISNTKRIDFEQKLNLKTQYEIIRNDRNLEDDDIIATGDILKTSTGEKYTLIVTGDINKDGDVNIKDLIKMRKYLLERNNLDETEKLAADCNLDGDDINIKDFIRMRIIALTKVYK